MFIMGCRSPLCFPHQPALKIVGEIGNLSLILETQSGERSEQRGEEKWSKAKWNEAPLLAAEFRTPTLLCRPDVS
jgi:hypothetical protein